MISDKMIQNKINTKYQDNHVDEMLLDLKYSNLLSFTFQIPNSFNIPVTQMELQDKEAQKY